MKIVLGLDGSPGSASTRRAGSLTTAPPSTPASSAVLVVPRVEVWELAAFQLDSGPILERRRELLEVEWTEPLRAAGLRVTTRLVRGDPATELCKIADTRGADLLVVGTKSHHAAHDLLGGTAHKISNRVNVPVLLVPEPSKSNRARRRAGPDRQA